MIDGERLRLRATEKEDIPSFVQWLNDREVSKNLGLSLPLSMVQEEHWFENMQKSPPAEQALVIEICEGDVWRAIGNISLMHVDWINRTAEVGLFIGEKSCWGKGYGREAMRLMLKHAFETLNLNRVFLRVNETNLRGIKSYEHAGFQHEGRLRQAVYVEGRYIDLLVMSVLRSEWSGSQS